MNDVKVRLRVLDQAGAEELLPGIWEDATSRQPQFTASSPFLPVRPRTRLVAVAVAALVSIGAIGFLWLAFAGSHPAGRGPSARPSAVGQPSETPSPVPVFDGWLVSVSVEPISVGPLRISVGDMSAGRHRVWVGHSFTLTNKGEKALVFGDFRRGAFLGGRSLMAGYGCGGYTLSKRGAIPEPSLCLSYLDIIKLSPGRSVTRGIALFKGLIGMPRLRPGTYVFPVTLSYQVPGSSAPPTQVVLRFAYKISPA